MDGGDRQPSHAPAEAAGQSRQNKSTNYPPWPDIKIVATWLTRSPEAEIYLNGCGEEMDGWRSMDVCDDDALASVLLFCTLEIVIVIGKTCWLDAEDEAETF